jgi:hypothetical protein
MLALAVLNTAGQEDRRRAHAAPGGADPAVASAAEQR